MYRKPQLEAIAHPLSQSFACLEFKSPRFSCPYHYHPEYELTSILSSRGKRIVGDSLEDFEPGDLVLLGKNLPHMYYNVGPSSSKQGAYSQVIQWRENALGDSFFHLPENQGLLKLFQRSAQGLCIYGKTATETKQLIARLFKSEGEKKILLFLEILHRISSGKEDRPLASLTYKNRFESGEVAKINRILTYIHEHFCEVLTLEAIAKQSHYTPTSFSRFFKKACKKSFVQYLNEIRLSNVRRLLLETDLSITEIAFKSGYNHLSNFNAMFQRYFKKSPKAFRREISK